MLYSALHLFLFTHSLSTVSAPPPPLLLLSGPRPVCEMSSLQRWTELCGEMPRWAAGRQQFHLQVRQGQQRVSPMSHQLHPGVSGGLLRHRDVCLCIRISADLSSVCLSNLWVVILTSESVEFRDTVLDLSFDPSCWISHPIFFKISYNMSVSFSEIFVLALRGAAFQRAS